MEALYIRRNRLILVASAIAIMVGYLATIAAYFAGKDYLNLSVILTCLLITVVMYIATRVITQRFALHPASKYILIISMGIMLTIYNVIVSQLPEAFISLILVIIASVFYGELFFSIFTALYIIALYTASILLFQIIGDSNLLLIRYANLVLMGVMAALRLFYCTFNENCRTRMRKPTQPIINRIAWHRTFDLLAASAMNCKTSSKVKNLPNGGHHIGGDDKSRRGGGCLCRSHC